MASRGLPDLTKGKIDKLIFLADKMHLVRYGRTITGDWYAALQHGPVPSKTDNLLDALEAEVHGYDEVDTLSEFVDLDRGFQYPRIFSRVSAASFMAEQLSESDLEILERITEAFGSRTFPELRAITHEMPAWERAWEGRAGGAKSAHMAFEDFFQEDEDAIPGAELEAIENSALYASFEEAALSSRLYPL